MAQISQYFFPPQYWQQFEDLTEAVFPYLFGDPSPSKVGRPGQSQNGVDVFGKFKSKETVGIQCKRMDEFDASNHPYPGGVISEDFLEEQYGKAIRFPKLDLWVLATTAKRDVRIQMAAHKLDVRSRAKGKFGVKLWFWDDYVTFLNNYDDLAATYYANVLKLRSPRDQDRLILELLSVALDRPAFHDPFRHEQADEFMQALKDSRTAFSTGELVDRETRHVIRKAIGGWQFISDSAWRDTCKEVYKKLQKLRRMLRDGLANGRIVDSGSSLVVRDRQLERDLLNLRRSCLSELNGALTSAGLPNI